MRTLKKTLLSVVAFAVIAGTGCGQSTDQTDTSSDQVNTSPDQVDTTPVAAAINNTGVNTDRIINHDSPEDIGQWLAHGRDYTEQRYVPLDQITDENVDQLELAWYGDLIEKGGAYEATPIVYDGMIYVTAPWSRVYAFDARTGEEVWKYNPEVPGDWSEKLCCGIVNRGVAVWDDMVVWATLDGRLIAVNKDTGDMIYDRQVTDRDLHLSITGAPRIANDMIFIGQGGGEFHMRGYMTAFDVYSGEELWRWWAVPGNPADGFEQPELEWAAETWTGEWWEYGGGGNPWDGVLYDPETNLVIIGTGNGAPWPAHYRSPEGGDNLFTASIVALDADTGEYVWHYQATPMDSFDFDNTSPFTVADLMIDGEMRHVVMQAPKNGVFYVIDVATGEVISADLFVPSANWMTGFDEENNWAPILNPDSNYGKTDVGWFIVPFQTHVWYPQAFSQDTGYIYIPANYGTYGMVAEEGARMGNQLLSLAIGERPEMPEPELEATGSYLLAWDPVERKEVWKQWEGNGRAGVVATAGNLLFQGTAGNTFSAFAADTGELLWRVDTQAGIVGGPVSYELDGEQYVAAVAGQSGGGFGGPPTDYWAPGYARLLVYKLGGGEELPEPISYTPRPLDPPENFGTPDQLAQGERHFIENCASCHAFSARTSTNFPDVRYANAALANQPLFEAIVLNGAYQTNGMPDFGDRFDSEDALALRAYITSQANDLKDNPPAPGGFGGFGGFGGGGAPADADDEEEEGELHQ